MRERLKETTAPQKGFVVSTVQFCTEVLTVELARLASEIMIAAKAVYP